MARVVCWRQPPDRALLPLVTGIARKQNAADETQVRGGKTWMLFCKVLMGDGIVHHTEPSPFAASRDMIISFLTGENIAKSIRTINEVFVFCPLLHVTTPTSFMPPASVAP